MSLTREPRRRKSLLDFDSFDEFLDQAAQRQAQALLVGFLKDDHHILFRPGHRLVTGPGFKGPVAGAGAQQGLA